VVLWYVGLKEHKEFVVELRDVPGMGSEFFP